MSKKILFLGVYAFSALVLTACSAGDGRRGSPAEGSVGQMSQALLPGSCAPFSCGLQSLDGCWCDELCLVYGDCCADKIRTCDVPTRSAADYPSGASNFWAEEAQGVSHDASSWYLSQNGPTRVSKVPLSYDLLGSSTAPLPPPPQAQIATIPANLQPVNESALQKMGRLQGCQPGASCPQETQPSVPGYNHVGDPDVYGQYLFVPLSGVGAPFYGAPDAPPPAVAVYRTSDMSFVRASTACGLVSANGGVGWVAINPVSKLLYTSDSHVNNLIQVCNLIDANIELPGAAPSDRPFLTFNAQIALVDINGAPLDLLDMQGGDLSDDGQRLFLSNGCCNRHSGSDYGLRAFDINVRPGTGIMLAGTTKTFIPKGNPWLFPFCANGTLGCADEPEGVDYGAVSGAPGITSVALLHVVLLNNFIGDRETFKHWRF